METIGRRGGEKRRGAGAPLRRPIMRGTEGERFGEGAKPPLSYTPLSSQNKFRLATLTLAGEGSGVR